MKKIVVILGLIVCVLPQISLAETVSFVTGANSPPYTYVEHDEIVGLTIDIVKEACTRLGLEPTIRREPWKRALQSVELGKRDGIIAPAYTEERSAFLYYPSESLGASIKVVFVILKGSGVTVTGLDDLKGKKLGIVSGYTYGAEFDHADELKEHVTIIETRDETQLLRMFDAGRMDVIVTREIPFRYLAKQLGLHNRFEIAHVLSEKELYVAFSKALGERTASFAEEFGNVLADMKAEGAIEDILNTYR